MLRSKDVDNKKFSQNLEEQERFLMCLKVFKKMELNIETIFQMTGKMILIALVRSETRTTQGLLTVFEEKDYFGIDSKAKSLYRSCTGSHFYGTEYEIWADFGLDGNTEKTMGDQL